MGNVRSATLDDIPRMVELGRLFLNETILADMAPYDPDSVAALLMTCIEGDNACALVLEQEGYIVGGFIGVLTRTYWNTGCLAAQQMAWYVEPAWRSAEALKLLAAWEKWCEEKGVRVIFSGRKMGYEAMERIFERRGYVPLETVHVSIRK